ncbi:MAG: SIMPL domain-containing protein [Candidatus Cloacimonadota bacterium]|nr:SIMPL domain-containing protein [Candidatus Cloacimonadota bacterium]
MNNRIAYILSIGIILAAMVFGMFFYASRADKNTIRVVGYATESFTADKIKWDFSLSANVNDVNDIEAGYIILQKKLQTFKQIWEKQDISYIDMNISPVNVNKQYGEQGKIVGNRFEQRIYIISEELDKLEELSINPHIFIENGIAFERTRLEYFSSELQEIKKQLLSAATINARERALKIASANGSKVGKLKTARAGVFQITEPYSTKISGYGIHSTSTREKNIKVTVTCTFYSN